MRKYSFWVLTVFLLTLMFNFGCQVTNSDEYGEKGVEKPKEEVEEKPEKKHYKIVVIEPDKLIAVVGMDIRGWKSWDDVDGYSKSIIEGQTELAETYEIIRVQYKIADELYDAAVTRVVVFEVKPKYQDR
ncbi:hypothetical protein AYK26_00660 [Euryarchaeota archaeon SM23-78]|nr:MAG: hypothetical protein AYK26_00660 [Euryarchaeota archaeon SM23-78]